MRVGNHLGSLLLNILACILVVLMAIPLSAFMLACAVDRRIEAWTFRRRLSRRNSHEVARLAGLRV